MVGDQTAVLRIARPRCFLVCALAPDGMTTGEANRQFNGFIADRQLPLVLFHDHFIGRPGGVAIFYVESAGERKAIVDNVALRDWRIEIRPLNFSYSSAAFDEQSAFTLHQYRGRDWEQLRREERPSFRVSGCSRTVCWHLH